MRREWRVAVKRREKLPRDLVLIGRRGVSMRRDLSVLAVVVLLLCGVVSVPAQGRPDEVAVIVNGEPISTWEIGLLLPQIQNEMASQGLRAKGRRPHQDRPAAIHRQPSPGARGTSAGDRARQRADRKENEQSLPRGPVGVRFLKPNSSKRGSRTRSFAQPSFRPIWSRRWSRARSGQRST